MIILDTNVVSEAMKPNGNPLVLAWLDVQIIETLYLTTTSFAELLLGVALLPTGKRKSGLATTLERLIEPLFGPRILAFDRQAAIAYAALVGRTKAKGHSLSVADGQIAAIAVTHGFKVATRDTGPFAAADVSFINPWKK